MVTVDFGRLTLKPGYKILDIGCGSGRHTSAAYQCPGVTAIGVDLNFDDLNDARSRLQLHDHLGEHGGGIWALSAADILTLPFKDADLDLVICSEVLEHILPHRTAIREIVRVLKPGGECPQILARTYLLDAFAGLCRQQWRTRSNIQRAAAHRRSNGSRSQPLEASFCPQPAYTILVVEMPARTRSR